MVLVLTPIIQAAVESSQTTRSAVASEWDSAGNEKPLPPTKTSTGDPSARGLKAKFEHLANPPPPKKTMGKVGCHKQKQ